MVNSKTLLIPTTKSLNSHGTQKAIDFVLYLVKECLLFDSLNSEQMSNKKRKRAKILTQICTGVNVMEIEAGVKSNTSSNKRLKTTPIPASTSSSSDVNNNKNKGGASNSSSSDTDESAADAAAGNGVEILDKKTVSKFVLSAKRNTWIGRRSLKRELRGQEASLGKIELEKLCSRKLWEQNEHVSKEIDFELEFLIGEEEDSLCMKFSLLEELPCQQDLVDFATLVHFVHVFVDLADENMFNEWTSLCRV